jgi:Tol biopolymer transport system component
MSRVIAIVAGFGFGIAAACVGSDPGPNLSTDGGSGNPPANDASDPIVVHDSGTGGEGCTPSAPFKTQTMISFPGTEHNDQMTLSGDERTIYFARLEAGQSHDIWVASRAHTTLAFDPPVRLGMNTGATEGDPALSRDDKFLFFTANKAGKYELFRLPVTALDGGGGSPESIPALGTPTPANETSSNLTDDGTLYFASDRGGTWHIYSATAAGSGFNAPEQVVGLQESGEVSTPVLSYDGLTIYWSSQPVGQDPPQHDIYVATRETRGAAFTNPRKVAELSTNDDETPGWLSPNGCRLYFMRRKMRNDFYIGDIYVASH